MPADPFDLEGRIAVVTGGSRGLGRAMSQALAEHGAGNRSGRRRRPTRLEPDRERRRGPNDACRGGTRRVERRDLVTRLPPCAKPEVGPARSAKRYHDRGRLRRLCPPRRARGAEPVDAPHERPLPVDRLGITLEAAPGFQLVISYNPGYESVLKDLKDSTRQRFVAIELDFPPADVDTEVVAHEAGIDLELAQVLVKVGYAIRNLEGSPLREVASARTLILAGALAAEGLSVKGAVRPAIVEVLSDDPDMIRALGELVDAFLPEP